ncbi:hypothetical protein COR53_01705 [Staphylococcus pettenkoferi]|nr:hypothetical protein CEP67_06770 [Staphylococcus pettenkoferi]RQN00321.1 hypothetical protein COR53_01705 [Staphylococcus pettenkoferi]
MIYVKKAYTSINIEKLKEQVNELSKYQKVIALDLLEELEFMKSAMYDLKETINKEGATYIFTQGEQSYLRENPAMKSYNTTVSKYNATLKQLLSLLPDEENETDELVDFVNNA